ncbi:MAG: hypothetical protein K2P81_13155 [Bacteriovoracaceae bacterium]|nr:hypothetical protein [Bacteriovoracaceae bacterium]
MSDFLRQLAFLNAFLPQEALNFDSQDLESQMNAKFLLMQQLRAHCVREITQNVTNRSHEKLDWYGYPLAWDYRRQQLFINKDLTPDVFHPGLKNKRSVATAFFTSSGQVAIHATLTTLLRKFGPYKLVTPHGIYFESQRAYDFVMHLQTLNSSSPELLVIDSGAMRPGDEKHLDALIKKCSWVMIDSTCWDSENPLLAQILELTKDKTVFLTRSHLKLDCFGAEYSLLGSVTLLSEPNQELANLLMMSISMVGGYPSFDEIYPFLTSAEHRVLTRERTKRIQKNTERLFHFTEKLLPKREDLKIVRFTHDLYFMIEFEPNGKNWPLLLEKWRSLGGSIGHTCDSFGFDGFTLAHFIQNCRPMRQHVIRFCGSDLPNDEIAGAEETIKHILSELI